MSDKQSKRVMDDPFELAPIVIPLLLLIALAAIGSGFWLFYSTKSKSDEELVDPASMSKLKEITASMEAVRRSAAEMREKGRDDVAATAEATAAKLEATRRQEVADAADRVRRPNLLSAFFLMALGGLCIIGIVAVLSFKPRQMAALPNRAIGA